MKKTFLALAMLLSLVEVYAQNVKLYKDGVLVATYSALEVDDVVFEDENTPYIPERGYNEGREYVNLGLPSHTLWATCNVGANSVEDFGDYYAWGEIYTKENYSWSTYQWCDGTEDCMTKYCTDARSGKVDGKTVLEPNDDVAHRKWGGDWRMPTSEEFAELIEYCSYTWVNDGGQQGLFLTSKINGQSIYFPAAGWRQDYSICTEFPHTLYWTSSSKHYPDDYVNHLYGNQYSNGPLMSGTPRYQGNPVRPVFSGTKRTYVTSVEISRIDATMCVGDNAVLTAKTLPQNATKPNIEWESNDDDVVTVEGGVLTAVGEGWARVFAKTTDGSNLRAACRVYVVPSQERGIHDFVDLGLPSGNLWAQCNIGAYSPEEYGDYFAWGETETKETFNWGNYSLCEGTYNTLTKYVTNRDYGKADNWPVFRPEDDVAHVKWGGKWHVPTKEDAEELLQCCIWTLTEWNGVKGYQGESLMNGNSIFLPLAGYVSSMPYYQGNNLFYWTSTVKQNSPDIPYTLNGTDKCGGNDRYIGMPVRPVRNK